MKIWKKVLCSLLVVVLCLTSAPLSGFVDVKWSGYNGLFGLKVNADMGLYDLEDTGQCGDKTYWNYDAITGKLVISGEGIIDTSDFQSCSIKELIIEEGVTNTGCFAFCDNLINVVIPKSVTSIRENAFYSCDSLTEITIPVSITDIKEEAFYWCPDLAYVYYLGTEDDWKEISISDGNDALLKAEIQFLGKGCVHTETEIPMVEPTCTIPGSTTGAKCSKCGKIIQKVQEIPAVGHTDGNLDDVCDVCGKSAIVPIGKCGDNCYYGFSADGQLVISGTGPMYDYNYSYDESPFCYNDIKYVVIDNGVTSIGDCAFYKCTDLESITIPDSVTSIGYCAFYECTSLETVTIPDSVTSIERAAFSWCESLASVTLPNGLMNIGDCAFQCTSLESITIPDNVTSIGEMAFSSCENLANVTLSNNLMSIGEYAFQDTSLENITIPHSVVSIGDSAFCLCTSLTNMEVDEENDYYCSVDGVLFNKNKTKVIQYPAGNKRISYSIPDNVTSIAKTAFYYCSSLTSITIPESITSIGEQAFYLCTNLTNAYFYGTEEQWNEISIGDYNEPLLNATIHFLGEEEEECTHEETSVQTIPASCTVSGMKFTVCVDCGETIGNPEVIPAAHTPGEWETVIEPTYEAEGKKVKKCTVCGETLEEEIIPKLELAVVEDEETGVGLEFPAENYDGKVEIEVKESFDGTAFNILDTKTGAVQKKIYDIKMLVDGEVTQPNGKITVRIPLPAGYNPKFSFVYYVNTETRDVEKMNATYEDGYMVFETDHFSYYAVIAEPDTDNCSCNCHAGGIKGFFFKFLLFFQKIFRTNKVCKCGINHY